MRKFQSSFYEGSELETVMIKPFQSTNYGSSPEGEVFLINTERCSTAHNWWSVKYETAASGTTQHYKGKM